MLRGRIAVLAALALGLAGCGIFGPAGPKVEIEAIDFGPETGTRPDSTTVQVRPGIVVLESTLNYGQGGYRVDGTAVSADGRLQVDVETSRLDGFFSLDFNFVRYRLTISNVDPGNYRLRLLWHNRFNPEAGQLRDFADTLITVP